MSFWNIVGYGVITLIALAAATAVLAAVVGLAGIVLIPLGSQLPGGVPLGANSSLADSAQDAGLGLLWVCFGSAGLVTVLYLIGRATRGFWEG